MRKWIINKKNRKIINKIAIKTKQQRAMYNKNKKKSRIVSQIACFNRKEKISAKSLRIQNNLWTISKIY